MINYLYVNYVIIHARIVIEHESITVRNKKLQIFI